MCRRVKFEPRERIHARARARRKEERRTRSEPVRSSTRFKMCRRVTSRQSPGRSFEPLLFIGSSRSIPRLPAARLLLPALILVPTIPLPTVSTFFALLNRRKVPLKRRLSRLPVTRAGGKEGGEREREEGRRRENPEKDDQDDCQRQQTGKRSRVVVAYKEKIMRYQTSAESQ